MYLVKVSWNNPYPVENEYRIEATNLATAAARGIRKWRKENKGRRVKNIKIQLIKL